LYQEDRHHMRGKLFVALIGLAILIDLLLIMGPGPAFASNAQHHVHTNREVPGVGGRMRASRTRDVEITGVYELEAVEIDGTDARLKLLPDPLHPVFTFSSTTIQGMRLTHPLAGLTLTISATGAVSTTDVAIKTSVLSDAQTALESFTNKLDLLTLIAGGTVKNIVMKNVKLKVDRYITLGTMNAPGFGLSVS